MLMLALLYYLQCAKSTDSLRSCPMVHWEDDVVVTDVSVASLAV